MFQKLKMLIGLRQRVGSQCLNDDKPLRNVSVAKYLGVYIDQYLTWRMQVDKVISKVRFTMYCIKRLQWISLYLFGLLYQVFVMSLFDYCDVVWSPMMNQLKIMECLHSKVMSERDYPLVLSTHYWNVDDYILLYRSIKYCIKFLLLTCLMCFNMLEMLLTIRAAPRVRTNYGKSSLYFRGTFL